MTKLTGVGLGTSDVPSREASRRASRPAGLAVDPGVAVARGRVKFAIVTVVPGKGEGEGGAVGVGLGVGVPVGVGLGVGAGVAVGVAVGAATVPKEAVPVTRIRTEGRGYWGVSAVTFLRSQVFR